VLVLEVHVVPVGQLRDLPQPEASAFDIIQFIERRDVRGITELGEFDDDRADVFGIRGMRSISCNASGAAPGMSARQGLRPLRPSRGVHGRSVGEVNQRDNHSQCADHRPSRPVLQGS
jgi:hypothetical protein